MVAMGRALMSEPRLLLLDEPTAGLSPAYLERIFDLILDIRAAGITILMVEQNARQALAASPTAPMCWSMAAISPVGHRRGTARRMTNVRRSFLGRERRRMIEFINFYLIPGADARAPSMRLAPSASR